MNKPLTLIISILGILTLASITSASTADVLQPASTITYNEDLTVNGTGRFNSAYIGKTTGEGGVTFFNGTMINASEGDVPLTMGDDLRVDGMIWRGPSRGTSDDMGLKFADSLWPALDNANDIGTSELQFKDAYFAGNVTVGNLLGSSIVDYSNLDTSNTASANQILSYNGTDLEWITVGTSSSDDTDDTDDPGTITVGDITSVTAGDGLDGGGTEGGVTLSVDDDLNVTTLITTGNITVGGDVDGVDVSNENAVYYSTTGGSDTNVTTPSSNPYPSKIIIGSTNVTFPAVCGMGGCYDTIELPDNFFSSNSSYVVTANQVNVFGSALEDLYISRTSRDTFKIYTTGSSLSGVIHWQAIGY